MKKKGSFFKKLLTFALAFVMILGTAVGVFAEAYRSSRSNTEAAEAAKVETEAAETAKAETDKVDTDAARTVYLESGMKNMPKLSRQEIATKLAQTADDTPTDPALIFDVQPNQSNPYSTGTVKHIWLEKVTARLNVLRNIAGLPSVTLDDSLSQSGQYGAVLLAVSNFAHEPNKPADMDDNFYQLGLNATSSSNLSAGAGSFPPLTAL